MKNELLKNIFTLNPNADLEFEKFELSNGVTALVTIDNDGTPLHSIELKKNGKTFA